MERLLIGIGVLEMGNTLSYTDNDWHDTIFYEHPNLKGTYQISLIVHDNKGCADTTQNLIVISDLYTIYIPPFLLTLMVKTIGFV